METTKNKGTEDKSNNLNDGAKDSGAKHPMKVNENKSKRFTQSSTDNVTAQTHSVVFEQSGITPTKIGLSINVKDINLAEKGAITTQEVKVDKKSHHCTSQEVTCSKKLDGGMDEKTDPQNESHCGANNERQTEGKVLKSEETIIEPEETKLKQVDIETEETNNVSRIESNSEVHLYEVKDVKPKEMCQIQKLECKTYESEFNSVAEKFGVNDSDNETQSMHSLKSLDANDQTISKNIPLFGDLINVQQLYIGSCDFTVFPSSRDDLNGASNRDNNDDSTDVSVPDSTESGQEENVISLREARYSRHLNDDQHIRDNNTQSTNENVPDSTEIIQEENVICLREARYFAGCTTISLLNTRRLNEYINNNNATDPRGPLFDLSEARSNRDLFHQRQIPLHNRGGMVDLGEARRGQPTQVHDPRLQHGPSENLLRHRPQAECCQCHTELGDVWCDECQNRFCQPCDAEYHGQRERQTHG